MPALRELQLSFLAALFDAAQESVHEHVRSNGIDAAARLDIYRNNLREGFVKALAIGFPVIERLAGTDYFRQLALAFLQAYPSRSGNLHHIGEPFAPFLQQKFDGTPYAYFADLAALEWAYQQALIAEDAVALTAEAFRDIDVAHYEHLRLAFHPTCAFIRSAFPIVLIWRANQVETLSDEVIDLACRADNVLVMRTAECVEFHRLPLPQFAFFEALHRGESLGMALERAQTVSADFDTGAALRHLLELRILTGVGLPATSA
jgi:hypothetical protein